MKRQLSLAAIFFLLGSNALANNYEKAGDTLQYLLPLTALGMGYMEDNTEGRSDVLGGAVLGPLSTYAFTSRKDQNKDLKVNA